MAAQTARCHPGFISVRSTAARAAPVTQPVPGNPARPGALFVTAADAFRPRFTAGPWPRDRSHATGTGANLRVSRANGIKLVYLCQGIATVTAIITQILSSPLHL